MGAPTIVTGKASNSCQTNGSVAQPTFIMSSTSESLRGPAAAPRGRGLFSALVCTVVLLCLTTLVLGWGVVTSTVAIRVLQQDVALLSLPPSSAPALQHLQDRILQLEATLLGLQNDMVALQDEEEYDQLEEEVTEALSLMQDDGDNVLPRVARTKRSPETLRRPSRYMQRPVPVYNKAYGINLKDSEGLQLYSTLQGPFDDSQGKDVSSGTKPVQRKRRPPILKSGDGIRRRRPRVKSLQQRQPRPSGGLVKNGDVLYRESLYKDTPGDDVWDTAVSKVQQGGPASPAPLTLPGAPISVTQRPRSRDRSRTPKRPNKRNTRRRRRGSRLTAAHFNGLPAAAGGSGTWEGAEWMEGLGLKSRYKTGGDHVLVAESGIYLIYAQVKFAHGPTTGFDVRINGRSEAACTQTGSPQPGTCFTTVVTYLPKSSVVRVESSDPQASVLRLQDGERASLGLVKLLDAPETYHLLFTD